MIRYTITTLCVLLAIVSCHAQSLSPSQVKQVFKGIDSVVTNYARLGSLLDPGQLKVSESAKLRYFELFKDSTTAVYGDLMNEHNLNLVKGGKAPKLNTMPLREYVAKVSMKFRYGMKIQVVNMDADLAGMKNNTIKVMIEQKVTGIKSKGLEVENHDTIAMNIEFRPNLSSPRIVSILPTGLGGAIDIGKADKQELQAIKPKQVKKTSKK
jgi:hypothetical protein